MTRTQHGDLLLAASQELLLLVDPRSRCVVEANLHAERALGYAPGGLIGKPVTELECNLQDAFYWEDVAGGRYDELVDAEGLLACADGSLLAVIKSLRVLAGAEGPMLALQARDARASAAAADALAATTALLRAVFESTAEGLLVLEIDGRIMNFNRRFAELWRLDDTCRGSDGKDGGVLRAMVRRCRRAPGADNPWRRLLRSDEDELEEQIELRDGRSLRVRSRPLLMQEQLRGRVITCSDVTERITYERELAAARDAAAASEKAKAAFLAMMSHEIRTPMSGILGMTELARDAARDPEQRRFIEMAHDSAEGLLTIINDLLDFSKIEAGKFVIEAIAFDLADLLRSTLQAFEWQARKRGLDFELSLPPELPPQLLGDPTRIRQILINLVGNALKFTEQGGISVALEISSGDATRLNARISVSDSGIGIPPEKQATIFEAFTQTDAETSRRYGGTGLGLTICARLSELMQGRIAVSSVPGEGSCFSFELPLGIAAGAPLSRPRSEAPPAAVGRLKILVAEDTEVNQVFLRHTLERAGHRMVLVDNGEAALEAGCREPFDVILMDVQMPRMDGFEATEALRGRGVTTPVIGLTAHAMEGIREQCLSHGMNGYLSKPIRSAALHGLLASISAQAPGEEDLPAVALPVRQPPAAEHELQREAAIENLGGDAELWAELLAMLGEQVAEDLPLIRAGLRGANLAEVRQATHRLKSSLAVVGASAAAAACGDVDEAARGGDLDAARLALTTLEARVDALRSYTTIAL